MAANEDTTTPRERLLAAFAESIREKGIEQTQIADIVRLARTSRRTFYQCFGDKDSCFIELIRESNAQIAMGVVALVDRSAPWQVQVDQAIDGYLDALTQDPVLTATASQVLPTLGPRAFALHQEMIELFARLVVEGLDDPERRRMGIRQVDLGTATMLIGGIAELIGRALYLEESLESVAATAKTVVKTVLAPGDGQAS